MKHYRVAVVPGDGIRLQVVDTAWAVLGASTRGKTLEIEAFIPCSDVDDVYFDKPYYLTPDKNGRRRLCRAA